MKVYSVESDRVRPVIVSLVRFHPWPFTSTDVAVKKAFLVNASGLVDNEVSDDETLNPNWPWLGLLSDGNYLIAHKGWDGETIVWED